MSKWVFITLVLLSQTISAQTFQRKSEPLPGDEFTKLLDPTGAVTNIMQMNARGLEKGFATPEPWSSSYWPIHKGLLANRYNDDSSPRSNDFSTNYAFYIAKPSETFIRDNVIESMSPAEKYDLLVGDSEWTLTHAMWKKGEDMLAQFGKVSLWSGICNGWAGVSHVGTPVPTKSVDVYDVTGRYLIRFYADDVKALMSYLWAASNPPIERAGNRCNQTEVVRDAYLRPTTPSCLDSNPMTWHLTLVNRVGLKGLSLVMDSSAGDEVWNYPVAGYDYSYFNPRTFEPSNSLQASIQPIEKLTADKFRAYRSPKAKYVVGIMMDTFHPALVEPNRTPNTSHVMHTMKFVYDLELDAEMNIVGGEWYGKDRADFLWTFPANSVAMSAEDWGMGDVTWTPGEPLPQRMAEQAQKASKKARVLATITQALLALTK